ncbi:MAG: Aliphatic sulfonates import ATP-binding protein SsuB [Alphaproteobacteria bacterium MarineAlpha9_Bin4]|nr:ABC transporter [Pelagibacterales bacterium]PPR27426.1 MAG: Aliphatic sulfonates import ATP-binding protein SsuB [Alphaproteobacteria bacterium MarineAlpha9_Bin4]
MATSIKINVNSKIFPTKDKEDQTYAAIKALNLNISKGEFCSVIGPSGCGKTTLLNLIAGLDKDLKGEILFDGGKKLDDIRIAYMFQNSRLLPWLNVLENVEVVLSRDQKLKHRAKEILSVMGLEKFLKFYPNQLSGGMQRRVALARSYSSQPELFLLDEPFISLDEKMANKLREMLINLWTNEPTTIVFVTHDLREAIYLSDRIIFLSKAPSKVILDKKVNIRRPRKLEDKKIETLREEILKTTKDIFDGEEKNA